MPKNSTKKCTHSELMLGKIENYCPVISRNTIVKNLTSMSLIWQAIRLHLGVVLTWLRLVHVDLPSLFKQRYGTEIRSRSLASLKPEISQALDSLLEEIHTTLDDRAFLAKARLTCSFDEEVDPDDSDFFGPPEAEDLLSPPQPSARIVPRRVSTKQSPHFHAFYHYHRLKLTLDTGAETSMIKSSVAKFSQQALQADGVTSLCRACTDTPSNKCSKVSQLCPQPLMAEAVANKVRIVNNIIETRTVRRQEQLCQAHQTTNLDFMYPTIGSHPLPFPRPSGSTSTKSGFFSDAVTSDSDNVFPEDIRNQFRQVPLTYDDVFNPSSIGYNGAAGPIEATVNMGPVQPPQRKGRRPEDVGVTVEYLNPSFLVKKPSGGFRLVTAFPDVVRYSRPQPSPMPDVDSTLRSISPWKYISKSDLTRAFYQIPLSKSSMKYCGVATPFRGIRVYTRSAMGMPGSETALEELRDVLQNSPMAFTVAALHTRSSLTGRAFLRHLTVATYDCLQQKLSSTPNQPQY
ncbi:hypothetical protein ACROYT_G011250 [Oculina patagonica]